MMFLCYTIARRRKPPCRAAAKAQLSRIRTVRSGAEHKGEDCMRFQLKTLSIATAIGVVLGLTAARAAPFMIVGDDEKVLWDDNGKPVLSPPGKDAVLILDLADPMNPKIVGNLPLKNSVVGPPVNLANDPTNSIALVADSVDIIKDGDALKQ